VSGGLGGTVAPRSAHWLVRSRRSNESRTSTMPKGAVWSTLMVPRVSMVSMVPQVSTMLEMVPDEMDSRCWPLFFVAQHRPWPPDQRKGPCLAQETGRYEASTG